MFKQWLYKWEHLESGKSGISETTEELTRGMFLEKLADWNRDSRWKYTEVSNDPINRSR